MNTRSGPAGELLHMLADAVGGDNVLTGDEDCDFFAADVYGVGERPIAVVHPGSIEELQAVVRLANAHGVPMAVRGGGASYTASHIPSTAKSLMLDSSRLNRIVEINDRDMYVTVECGVTWSDLRQALKARQLRTPFWGPFSGLAATVGGSTSQNSASLGSGNYGISADSVLGFEIVLGNGEQLRTGSYAAANGRPFFRWYGPDLTGLFCGDSGALGIKATVTLRLIPEPPAFGAASFGFASFEAMAEAMAAAARTNLLADNYGFDPTLQQGQMGNVSAKDALAAAISVVRASRGPLEAARRLASMAVSGRRFLSGWPYSCHFITEGVSRAEINSKLAVIRGAVGARGRETANTIPTVIRSAPFVPLSVMVGPRGERWAPQHGIIPFSAVEELHSRLAHLYARNADRMTRFRVIKGAMFMTLSTHAFLYEPVLYWEDELTLYHRRYLGRDALAGLPTYTTNADGRALVRELREEIQGIFTSVGAVHLQVGKCYPYMEGRHVNSAAALRKIKAQLDPQNLMNPGALGL